jgi:hypothetical protein
MSGTSKTWVSSQAPPSVIQDYFLPLGYTKFLYSFQRHSRLSLRSLSKRKRPDGKYLFLMVQDLLTLIHFLGSSTPHRPRWRTRTFSSCSS